ncbi:cell division protein ZapD [Oxalobacter aliiformigenes]|uniref:Cell division protein ZapD n=1 Tax=Oxalobacter aliiformigenes TaxID=2946593 RepID=A0ABY7JIW8_9BURK|nr:cell division protein ZapD [Oxalobacter aliiformigenes]WAV93567.1 cell division protein ZapD [Oxalobacter aliiformigenes]WAV94937.1 cell division protein ZapD [Oxalobacter aliiformigenes]WAV97262.1 cell division protein ZapD [Oxalobacter aliiformigenes]
MIIYEYPFNERIRTLLRLEDLHERYSFFLHQGHALQHHVALTTVFEMLEVASRSDLKSDLLQELERQKQILSGFQSHPNIQRTVLDDVLREIDNVSTALVNTHGKTGQSIRENEWLMSVRGRTIIPGGACEFDLPSYYAWQHRSPDERARDIAEWFSPMQSLINAVGLVLRLLRASGIQFKIIANSGSYQQMLQGKVHQMLRLRIDSRSGAIPEASANKYMLWIRFTKQDGTMKPKPFEEDIPCELTLC